MGLKLEGRTKPVVDPTDNVWRRNRATDPWRAAIDGDVVYRSNEDMNPFVREIGDPID